MLVSDSWTAPPHLALDPALAVAEPGEAFDARAVAQQVHSARCRRLQWLYGTRPDPYGAGRYMGQHPDPVEGGLLTHASTLEAELAAQPSLRWLTAWYQGRVCQDQQAQAQLAQAMRQNQALPLLARLQQRHTQDLVVLVEGWPQDDLCREHTGAAAIRQQGYTELSRSSLDIRPRRSFGRGGESTSGYGLSTVLRHEYGHELWQLYPCASLLWAAQQIPLRGSWRRQSTFDLLRREISEYAAECYQKAMPARERSVSKLDHARACEEAWCEMLALVTHQAYPEQAQSFSPWFHHTAAALLRVLGERYPLEWLVAD